MMKSTKDIWVFGDYRNYFQNRVTLQILSRAVDLATTTGGQVCAIVFGHNVNEYVAEYIAHGAKKVYVMIQEQPHDYHANGETLSVDKIAVGIMVALSMTGILTPKETVAGFSNSAVITVGAMFLITRGLIRTGAVGFITEIVLKLSKGKKELTFILILVTVAFASAFINNTPVVVLFIPIVMGSIFIPMIWPF